MRRLLFLIALSHSALSMADDLLSLYQRAVVSAPALNGSEYALAIARAEEDQALGRLLPKAEISGNYSLNRLTYQNRPASEYAGIRAGLNVVQPLFDLQSYLLMKSQEARTSQGEEELLAAHQQLIYDLVERYVNALEAADNSEIIAAELAATEQQLKRVTAMQARQLALITDLYELQARVATLRTQLLDSDNQARISLEKLRELTGDAVSHLQAARLDVPQAPPEGSIEAWVQQAGQNPELLALKHAVEAARRSITAYRAGHLPRIELQIGGNYSDTSFNNQQSLPYDVGSASVQATLPLYEGGMTEAKVRAAQAQRGLSAARLEQKRRELEQLTRAAYMDMAAASARNQATDSQLQASEKSRDAMKKGYELGVVTIVDLLAAEQQLSAARKSQRLARYRYFKARSALYRQAGRLLADELVQLNNGLLNTH